MAGEQSIAQGALVLTASSLYNRVLGFVYQILMVRLLKAEGIGLFSMVYPVYVLFLVMASAGVPVAVAKLVAEENARGNLPGSYRIFRIAMGCIVVSAVLLTLAVALYGPVLLDAVLDNPDARPAFMVLTPGIFVVAVCSGFRGFFQGLQQMTPTAVTQAVEQSVRVLFGLLLAYLLMPRGIAWATAGASAGVVLGETAGLLLMLAIYFVYRPPAAGTPLHLEPVGTTCRRIFALAGPVTASRVVATALMSVDAILIPRRLAAAGLATAEATAAYGKLVGMAQTMLYTPGILTISLATALVPAISAAHARRDTHLLLSRVASAMRLTILIGFPSAVIFLLLPQHICGLLFGYPDAGVALAFLALGGPFLYVSQTTTGILQGLGKASQPLINLLIASVVKMVGIYYLTVVPGLQVNGAALALTVHFFIMALLNTRDVGRVTGFRVDYANTLGKGALSAAAMGMVIHWLDPSPESLPVTAFALAAGLATYTVVTVASGVLPNEEITRLRHLARHLIRRNR